MDFTGATIAGRYRVDRKIATGGMGEVWEGRHVALGVRVAVKMLLPTALACPELVRRFRREARLLGRIRSEHVARILDLLSDELHGPVLVMEFVDGELLSDVFAKKVLSVPEALELGIALLDAVCALHAARIIHRDLKPANVILRPTGGAGYRAILVDLGIGRVTDEAGSAKVDGDTEITRADVTLGTFEYMAPEQVLTCGRVEFAADVYAVGAILYRAVTGTHVFDPLRGVEVARRKLVEDPTPLPKLGDDPLSTGFAAVVMRALQRVPADRYATARAMLDDLLALRESDASTAPAFRTGSAEARSDRRSRPPSAWTSALGEIAPMAPRIDALVRRLGVPPKKMAIVAAAAFALTVGGARFQRGRAGAIPGAIPVADEAAPAPPLRPIGLAPSAYGQLAGAGGPDEWVQLALPTALDAVSVPCKVERDPTATARPTIATRPAVVDELARQSRDTAASLVELPGRP